jgi:hypothetical protein
VPYVHFSGDHDTRVKNPEMSTPSVPFSGLREHAAEIPDFCTHPLRSGPRGRVEPGEFEWLKRCAFGR